MFSVSTINFPALKSDLLQQELFERVRDLLPSNLSLVEEISTLLRISHDSAYRRIRGEKSISFAELQTLSTHYRISLDSILKIDSRSSVFYGNWLRAKGFNFRAYLSGLLDHTQHLEGASRKIMYFEAKDVLPFEYLPFPELCAFNYFFWIRTVINHPEYANVQFEDHNLGEVLDEITPQLAKAYQKIPTTEIWSECTINSILHQIAYYEKSGAFRNADTAERLYDQVAAMLEHVRKQAACGYKLTPDGKKCSSAPFELYLNEAYLGHNTTFIEADGLNTVFVNHCVVNMIMTHDPDFCASTQKYFEEGLAHATPLNGADNAARETFFQGMQEKVQRTQMKPA